MVSWLLFSRFPFDYLVLPCAMRLDHAETRLRWHLSTDLFAVVSHSFNMVVFWAFTPQTATFIIYIIGMYAAVYNNIRTQQNDCCLQVICIHQTRLNTFWKWFTTLNRRQLSRAKQCRCEPPKNRSISKCYAAQTEKRTKRCWYAIEKERMARTDSNMTAINWKTMEWRLGGGRALCALFIFLMYFSNANNRTADNFLSELPILRIVSVAQGGLRHAICVHREHGDRCRISFRSNCSCGN